MLRPDYPITTARLLLRPFTPGDLDALNSFQSRADVARYLYWGPRSRADSAAALAKRVHSSTLTKEGQFLAVVSPEYAEAGLAALRAKPGGNGAEIIGEVREQPAATVMVSTLYGGTRVVDILVGDPLPRIC